MTGDNELRLNRATMLAAINYWLKNVVWSDKVILQEATEIHEPKNDRYGDAEDYFTIKLTAKELTPGA